MRAVRLSSRKFEPPSIERNGFVMHVNPRSTLQLLTAFFSSPAMLLLSVVIFDPDSTFHEITQSDSMVRVSDHVQDVSMQN